MTTAVTSKKGTDMTAGTIIKAGLCIGKMSTASEFMYRRRSSMNRLHRRASVSFSHPSLSIPKIDGYRDFSGDNEVNNRERICEEVRTGKDSFWIR